MAAKRRNSLAVIAEDARQLLESLQSEKRVPKTPPAGMTRGECEDGPRPCPYTSCRFHLDYEWEGERDGYRVPRFSTETCALDIADRGPQTSDAIAEAMGLRRQGVEEIASEAMRKIRESGAEFDEREHPDDPYLEYSNMGADELAEITAELRARGKVSK